MSAEEASYDLVSEITPDIVNFPSRYGTDWAIFARLEGLIFVAPYLVHDFEVSDNFVDPASVELYIDHYELLDSLRTRPGVAGQVNFTKSLFESQLAERVLLPRRKCVHPDDTGHLQISIESGRTTIGISREFSPYYPPHLHSRQHTAWLLRKSLGGSAIVQDL